MEVLDQSNPLRQLYPEDLYPDGTFRLPISVLDRWNSHVLSGSYFQSPYGRTRYWIVGPETGKKVRVQTLHILVHSGVY